MQRARNNTSPAAPAADKRRQVPRDRKPASSAASKDLESKKSWGNGGSPLSQIQDFYRFMLDQSLDTLEYDHEGLHVRMIRRRATQVPVPVPLIPAAGYSAGTAPAAGIAVGAGREENGPRPALAPTAPALPPNATTIKSPMMGIFYRASTPSSPPFVKSGDLVKKGQILCLIEAMKVFNEVKADFDCVVIQNLLDNGKPVKVGQDLFSVERK